MDYLIRGEVLDRNWKIHVKLKSKTQIQRLNHVGRRTMGQNVLFDTSQIFLILSISISCVFFFKHAWWDDEPTASGPELSNDVFKCSVNSLLANILRLDCALSFDVWTVAVTFPRPAPVKGKMEINWFQLIIMLVFYSSVCDTNVFLPMLSGAILM